MPESAIVEVHSDDPAVPVVPVLLTAEPVGTAYRYVRLSVQAIVNAGFTDGFTGLREFVVRQTAGGANVLAGEPATFSSALAGYADPYALTNGSRAEGDGWAFLRRDVVETATWGPLTEFDPATWEEWGVTGWVGEADEGNRVRTVGLLVSVDGADWDTLVSSSNVGLYNDTASAGSQGALSVFTFTPPGFARHEP